MLWGGSESGLEVRRAKDGSTVLSGSFPYGKAAVLSDGGRTGKPRKEVIASRAFAYRVERPEEDIHFLYGHSFDRPLASRSAGTLDLKDSDDALTFKATIRSAMQDVSYVRDFLAGLEAGLITGISPGFRIPPKRAVEKAESVEQEDPSLGTALIRTVHQALLYELSAVTRPAYPEAQVEARDWNPKTVPMVFLRNRHQAYNRWRA